jgi:hypothetical protein
MRYAYFAIWHFLYYEQFFTKMFNPLKLNGTHLLC